MKILKGIQYVFGCSKIKLLEASIIFNAETLNDTSFVRYEEKLDKKIVKRVGSFERHDIYDVVHKKLPKRLDKSVRKIAKKLLKEWRKPGKINTTLGVKITGKHIIAVTWEIGNTKTELISFEEFVKEIKK